MACMMAPCWRLEKAAAKSMDRMALSVLWSRRVWVSLCSSTAPEGRPMAYWCGLRVVAVFGVMWWVVVGVGWVRDDHLFGERAASSVIVDEFD